MESRLTRNLERKTKRKFLLSVIGTIVILFLLLRYGMPLLVNFSLFIAGTKSSTTQQQGNSKYVAPPILNTTMTATNSASIDVNGNAAAKEQITLYVNDSAVDQTDTKDDGSFVFKDVVLKQGSNDIKAKAKNDASESDYSDSYNVMYSNVAPSLSIDQPSDNQTFSQSQKTLQVKGKTDPNIRVTVNGFWAVTDDSGNYTYTMQLQNGDNKIDVVASDVAGNKTEKVVTVHVSQ